MISTPAAYRFERFVLDLRRGALLADGGEVVLRPKSFALLRHLVENAERLVDRDEIMRTVWPGVIVTDDSIAQCIHDIRRALGDSGHRLLRTVPRRGYRFGGPATRPDEPDAPAAAADARVPEFVPAPPIGRPMLVVCPFVDLGGNPELAYFADGLTADLATDLTRFQDFHVIGPQRLSGPVRAAAGAALPNTARYTLGGTLRRADGRIRLTAQLDDAQTGVRIWAERFDCPRDDLFAVQEDMADHIAALVESQIGRESLRRARRRAPANFSAYDWLLHGRDLHGRTNEADNQAARKMFDRAIGADGVYASAYAYQSFVAQRGFTLNWGEPRGRAALGVSLDFAQRAVALESDSSLCLMRIAFVLSLLGRDDEAVESGRRGVRANPCDATSRHAHGEILSRAGFHEAGVVELRRAISLNPFHPPFWRATLGRALLLVGQNDEALAELRLSAALAPDYRPVYSSMVVAFVEMGRMEEARSAMNQVLRLRPGWSISRYDGEFGLRKQADTARFLAAFRAAGMPEG